MKFQVKNLKARPAAAGLVLTYFAKDKPASQPFWRQLKATDKKQVERYFQAKEFIGKEGEAKVLLGGSKTKIFLLGLGERSKWNTRRLILLTRKLIVLAKSERIASINLAVEQLGASGLSTDRLAQTVAENAVMANYDFLQYKQKADNGFKVKQIILSADKLALPSVQAGARVGQTIGEQVNDARDLGNIPGGEMTPSLLAQKAQLAGRDHGFKVKILGRTEMKKIGLGAILGVAHGSAEEPKFIIMEYHGANKKQSPYVFVGKGVTFDTGGLNLKPEKGMNDMHLDMLGGAAVIAALGAVARLKLPINVIGLVPTVENMPGNAGYRPGDVLKSLSGKTIEVLNTDAEGRIILADALTYAERYQPKLVIDVATLTGACQVALGVRVAGLMTPDTELQTKLQQAGEISGDYVWPLPLWEEYEEEIKGTFGDVQNLGKSGSGGAITAAAFLWQFAKNYPWAHLDIAGTMKTVEGQYLAKGASGSGTRFLIEIARNLAN
jgi:leucyl aminopeptidase